MFYCNWYLYDNGWRNSVKRVPVGNIYSRYTWKTSLDVMLTCLLDPCENLLDYISANNDFWILFIFDNKYTYRLSWHCFDAFFNSLEHWLLIVEYCIFIVAFSHAFIYIYVPVGKKQISVNNEYSRTTSTSAVILIIDFDEVVFIDALNPLTTNVSFI